MRVWRVGHSTAQNRDFPIGPYIGIDQLPKHLHEPLNEMARAHGGDYVAHPEPWGDRLLRGINPSENCGFSTLGALYDWFGDYAEMLHGAGYVVYEYKVPSGWVRPGAGAGQVVFDRTFATEIARSPISTEDVQLPLF